MAQLYYAYANQDARYKDQLELILRGLKTRGALDSWQSRAIGPGAGRAETANRHLEQADVVVFLLSRDLLAGDYAHSADVRAALDRHRSGDARVLAVLLRPCPTKGTPFAALPTFPSGGKPVTEWKNADAAFESVAAGIAAALARQDSSAAAALSAHPSATMPERPDHAEIPGAGTATAGEAAASASAPSAVPTAAQVALQASELGPDYVEMERPAAQDASANGTRFASVACMGSPRSRARRVAQLVNRVSDPQNAVDRLEAAVRAELAKGGRIDPLAVSPEPGVACKRVRVSQPSPAVSVYAAKGRFLVAAKVIDGEPDEVPAEDAAALASNVVRRMLVRIPS